jgi:Uma2 family endonuclease
MHLELPDASTPLSYARNMTKEEFERFCFANPEMVIEREPDGTLTIMSPISYTSSRRETKIIADLDFYCRKNGGEALSSSTGFRLPDSSVRFPDACYVSAEQLKGFTEEDLRHFASIVPEFIVEVISPTDRLKGVEEKMRNAWIGNGVELAWSM